VSALVVKINLGMRRLGGKERKGTYARQRDEDSRILYTLGREGKVQKLVEHGVQMLEKGCAPEQSSNSVETLRRWFGALVVPSQT
jgi:hypothetical protein